MTVPRELDPRMRFGVDYARGIARAIQSRYALAGASRTPGNPDPLVRVLERRPG